MVGRADLVKEVGTTDSTVFPRLRRKISVPPGQELAAGEGTHRGHGGVSEAYGQNSIGNIAESRARIAARLSSVSG
jgi:hypothetical protein